MKKSLLLVVVCLLTYSINAYCQKNTICDTCPIYESQNIDSEPLYSRLKVNKVDFSKGCCGDVNFSISFSNYSGFDFTNIVLGLTYYDKSGKKILFKKTNTFEYVLDGTKTKTITFKRKSQELEVNGWDKLKLGKIEAIVLTAVAINKSYNENHKYEDQRKAY